MILHSKIINPEATGTPLLIIHGLFGMLDNWQTLGKQFAENNKPVHLIDLRNHGNSFHADEMNLDIMAKDIQEYVNHYQLQQYDLIGHSLGGKVALKTLELDEERIHKLIVVDIALKKYPPHHQNIIFSMKKLIENKPQNRKEAEVILSEYIQEIDVRLFILKGLMRNDNNEFIFKFNLDVIEKNYLHLLTEIKPVKTFLTPTLFIKGGVSSYILDEDLLQIQKYYLNNQVKTIEKAGHWAHAQCPKEFYECVNNYLV